MRQEENMKCLNILVGKGRGHLEYLGIDEAIILKGACEYVN
jgi:hypothetical protein